MEASTNAENVTNINAGITSHLGADFRCKAIHSAHRTMVWAYMRKSLKKSEKIIQAALKRQKISCSKRLCIALRVVLCG